MSISSEIYDLKRKYFDGQHTKPYTFRVKQLENLKKIIKKNEEDILQALYQDLHKPKFEAFSQEIGVVYKEINYAVQNLKKWMKPLRQSSPLMLLPSSCKIYSEPYGIVLIISPWNYPFQLSLVPLIGAIAAGNCSVMVPSSDAKHTSDIIEKIITQCFPGHYVSVLRGEGCVNVPLLMERFQFDYIFFTGSPAVGKYVYGMAAARLTPITLELGGKSPAIVDKHVSISHAAKKIVWSKFINAGQVCVAPDYVLVHEDIKNILLERLIVYIKKFFGENPMTSNSYGRIINNKRFQVLTQLLKENTILYGGQTNEDELYIAPTLVGDADLYSRLMKEEIFGPILPILTFKHKNEALKIIQKNEKPLALYLYTKRKSFENYFLQRVSFGGGSINDSIVQLGNPKIPFGGVGKSGVGMYHGKYSFDTFSHKKSILKSLLPVDLPLRYPPYTKGKYDAVKKIFHLS